jgi:trehalose synthase
MADLAENALIVNALQREADVIVKKSLQEGFGLGVTEGMWKAKPVVATKVGGHRDQIEHRRSGLLVDDPADLSGFATAIDEALADPVLARELGTAARERVRARYLADRHFISWMEVLRRLPVPA